MTLPSQENGKFKNYHEIDWQSWRPQIRATLVFVVNNGQVLLIRKKRGLGAGKINGPGGKIDPGETILQAAMATARTRYDTILLDCPPMLGNLTLNALLAADAVLVPCDMSILALEGVADLLDLVVTVRERLRHPLDVLGVLRTRVDGRNKSLNDEVGQALADNFGDLLLDTVIPVNSALAAAQSAGQSIFAFRPRSAGADAYRALAAEMGRRLG